MMARPTGGEAGLGFLGQVDEAIKGRLASTRTLRSLLGAERRLGRDQRRVLVEQARAMLETTYVHLPQKRAMYAVDPIQRLRLLEHRLEQSGEADLPPVLAFHNELTEIFTSLRDRHTNYLLPAPFRDQVAYLPFLIEECCDPDGTPHYIVSRVMSGYERQPFEPNVEVLYWNGVPITRAIAIHASQQAGANPDARHALGLSALTIRPLVRMLPPAEEWVAITYRGLDGRRHELRQEWLVSTQTAVSDVLGEAGASGDALAFGFDLQADRIQQTRKVLFAPGAVRAEATIDRHRAEMVAPPNGLETTLPGVFRAQLRQCQSGEVGYLRIFTFMVADADGFVAELRRLLGQMPACGLILDVRGNGGGNILASERSLQLLTDRTIEPQRWQFLNSPLTLALCRRYADLATWEPSIAQAVTTGTLHSLAFPITTAESANAIGRVYKGPVVLIVDGMCYSATDTFAAGFQDHEIGPILGTSGNTGAGGANVWTHADLAALTARPGGRGHAGDPFRPLPRGADMRVAVRRAIRVGRNAGIPVEDLGVVPREVHRMTRRDLLDGNGDLLERAAGLLKG
jgi:hypothetical protein